MEDSVEMQINECLIRISFRKDWALVALLEALLDGAKAYLASI